MGQSQRRATEFVDFISETTNWAYELLDQEHGFFSWKKQRGKISYMCPLDRKVLLL